MILEGKIPIVEPEVMQYAVEKIHSFANYHGDMVWWTNDDECRCLPAHKIKELYIEDNHVYYKLKIHEAKRVLEEMRLHRWFVKLYKNGNGIDIVMDLQERTIPMVEAVV